MDVGVGDAAAAARAVDHAERHGDQLVLGEYALDLARRAVVAAAGRGADHDLDVLLRRPALGERAAVGRQRRGYQCKPCFHVSSSRYCGFSPAALTTLAY